MMSPTRVFPLIPSIPKTILLSHAIGASVPEGPHCPLSKPSGPEDEAWRFVSNQSGRSQSRANLIVVPLSYLNVCSCASRKCSVPLLSPLSCPQSPLMISPKSLQRRKSCTPISSPETWTLGVCNGFELPYILLPCAPVAPTVPCPHSPPPKDDRPSPPKSPKPPVPLLSPPPPFRTPHP